MSAVTPRVRLRPLVLPNEHGVWGFLLEPGLLGILLAPTVAGATLLGAALFAALAQHPLSLALSDMRRGKSYPRTKVALGLASAYGAAGLLFFVATLFTARDLTFLLPLLAATPFALAQLWYDARNRGREYLPEVTGALALNSLVTAVALLGGWPAAPAFLLWAALALRTVPSIAFVRNRIRLDRGQSNWHAAALVLQVASLAAVLLLAAAGLLPTLALAGYLPLHLLGIWSLSRWRIAMTPKTIGFMQLGLGAFLVVLLAFSPWPV